MKKKLLEKLRSRRGESIAEVLVAMLISAVALVLLASMIVSSSRLILRSRDRMAEYDAANNALAVMSADEDDDADDLLIVRTGTVQVKDTANTAVNLTGASGAGISVKVYENKGYGGKSVIAYKITED